MAGQILTDVVTQHENTNMAIRLAPPPESQESPSMHDVLNSILVIGHFNPDTDSSTSAVCYADFLNRIQRYESPAFGVTPGPLTPQAKHAFRIAGVPEPPIVENIETRVGHVLTESPRVLSIHDRLGTAFETLVREDVSVLPIVDEDGKLQGCFSNRSDATCFLLGFDPTPLHGTLLTLEDVVSIAGVNVIHDGLRRKELSDQGVIHFAMDGDRSWTDTITSEDTLVCGSLATAKDIPDSRFPTCIVVVSDVSSGHATELEKVKRTRSTLLQLEQGIAAFVTSLSQQIRLGALSLPVGICVGELDRVSDIEDLLTENHHALPVVDEEGYLKGVISRSDAKRVHSCDVILVDHFEKPQAIRGIENAGLLEILDHHRVGDMQTGCPIRVQCRPVGSTCTIIADNYRSHKVTPTREIATLLLSGIIADTLLLTAPTTTDTDREMADMLADLAGVDLTEFGRELLIAGDDLTTADPARIWHRDRKEFSIRNQSISIAQLETVSLGAIPGSRLDEFRSLAMDDHEKHERLMSLLVLTDVLNGDSWICALESEAETGLVRETFSHGTADPQEGWISAPGIVSRKKQLVPALMAAVASRESRTSLA